MLPGMEAVRYPDWASLLERWWRDAPEGTVLALDEFPYLAKASPELPSVLQRLIDQNRSRRLHLVLCGSSQRMMQGLVLDASAPLYGRAREVIEVKPLGASWLGVGLSLSRPSRILEAFAIWGGVPRYWDLAGGRRSTWESVEELVLDPMGVLHNEPRRLLMDDMRDTAQASSILSLVGAGCSRMSEIAARLAKPATSLTRPMQRLMEVSLVRREIPFAAPERSNKRTLYRIDDPFLSFWFRYVEPNRSRLEVGAIGQVRRAIQKDFSLHLGAVWENMVRCALPRLDLGGVEWMPARRWWGTGTNRKPIEVDVVAESVDGSKLFVGEVKLRCGSREAERAEGELLEKSRQLPFADSYERVDTCLFVAQAASAKMASKVVSAADVLPVCD
mgnify:CR=1 FL=1